MQSSPAQTKEQHLVTPDFVFTTSANFFNSFGQQMLTTVLPLYVLTIGGNQADAGLVAGALAFTALLLRPLVGWLTDVWRRRPLILIGTSCYGLASVTYMLAGSVPVLLFARAVHGFGLSNYTTAVNAYLADIAPPRRRAEALGFFAAAQDVGLITGPAVGYFIATSLGFSSLFAFSAGLAFLAFVISYFARERRQPPIGPRQPWSPRTGIVTVEALPVAWLALCLGVGFGPIMAFISIFAQSRDLGNPGLYFTVQAIALLVSRTFSGRLADRRGRAYAIVPGTILTALALLVLSAVDGFPSFVLFMVSAALLGLGFGMAQPATMALLVDQVQPEQRGLAMSTYFTGFDVGISLGSIGLGLVSQACGFHVMWSIAAACTLFGLLGLRKTRRSPLTSAA